MIIQAIKGTYFEYRENSSVAIIAIIWRTASRLIFTKVLIRVSIHVRMW